MGDDIPFPRVMTSTPVTAVTVHRDGRREPRRSYVVYDPARTVPPSELTVQCLKDCCVPAEATA